MRTPAQLMLSVFLVMLISVSAVAAEPVRGLTVEGRTVHGDWAGLDGDGKILLDSGDGRLSLPQADLMLLRWLNAAASQPASRPGEAASSQPADSVLLLLTDGSRVPARILTGGARQIEVQAGVTKLVLPLSALAAIRYAAMPIAAAEEAMNKALAAPDPSQDLLLTVRENRATALRGAVESLDGQGGAFRWRDRLVPIRRDSVYAVVFAAGTQRPAPAPAVCRLRDGSAWAGRITAGSPAAIQLALAAGGEVSLPVAELSEIRFRSDRVVFLSDLKPVDYVFEPYAATRWPYRLDRSVANRTMQIADQTFDRGIGMHSQSRLSFEPPAGFTRLAATIGIDAVARPRGNVVFRVLADGREVFNSGIVTGRDAPRPILVEFGAAKRLDLAVDFGDDLDVGDQADWANARLIK